jgi:hypothetical protein
MMFKIAMTGLLAMLGAALIGLMTDYQSVWQYYAKTILFGGAVVVFLSAFVGIWSL